AAILHRLAIFRIAQHGDEYLVELQVAAAGIGEGPNGLPVGLAEIVEKGIKFRIDASVDRGRYGTPIGRRWRGYRYLRRAAGVRRDELEMLKHRMAGKADLAGDLQALIACGHRGKGDAGVHHMLLDAVETPEKVEMPPGAAEFAVGDRLQTGLLLLPDDALDLAVLDFLQLCRRQLALGTLLARSFQR